MPFPHSRREDRFADDDRVEGEGSHAKSAPAAGESGTAPYNKARLCVDSTGRIVRAVRNALGSVAEGKHARHEH